MPKALIRAELDVPIKNGVIQDLGRLENIKNTVEAVAAKGYEKILFGHMGRPQKVGNIPELSTKQLVPALSTILGENVEFCVDLDSVKNSTSKIKLLENTRFDPREEQNSIDLANEYAALADIYVNDCFSVSHREHSSLMAIADLLPAYQGDHLASEVKALQSLLDNTEKPFIGIVGGAKVSDKLEICKKLVKTCDQVIIGGAMIFTFLLAKGLEVGNSLNEIDYVDEAKEMLATNRIILPVDIVTANSDDFSKNINTVAVDAIQKGTSGFDIGPKSVESFKEFLHSAKNILWNGPMGMVEVPPFEQGTKALAEVISQSQGYSLVGGGDSVSIVKKLGYEDKFSHISSGGGAMLEFIEKGTLPTLKNLKKLESL